MSVEARLAAWVQDYLAHLLGRAAQDIQLDKNLADYGLDSVDAILMAGELEQSFEVELDPAIFMQFDSFAAMIAGVGPMLKRRD